jgi:energy-coupling factor transport system ATP-binding protein
MIEVRDTVYRYPAGTQPALRGVSLQIGAGDVVGIVGPNGSGKSTLGRLLKGLVLPDTGAVSVDGVDTRTEGLEVRRLVGLVFQNPNSQIVNAVVENEIAFGPENQALPPEEIRRRVDMAVRAVGLQGHERAECHALSMADKQRVALAAVMAMEPRYLILDEPTAWLEPAARWRLLQAVIDWARERNAGLILVTHRMDEAQVCGRLYGMLDGKIEIAGTPEEVLQNEVARKRLALAIPEAFMLASDLREAGLPVAQGASLELVAEAICRS